ncbi:MAG: hydroxyacylglutathione hydrolase C-terminal domain-containing protein, partial [Stenotrophobium sp.]
GGTRVYCTHEYTLSNLAFAAAVEPHNTAVGAHLAEVRLRRASGEPSLPSTVAQELLINPFLRTGNADVIEAASRWCGRSLNSPEQTFAELRRWKDGFRAPTPP